MDCSLANIMALGAKLAGVKRESFGGIPAYGDQRNWKFEMVRADRDDEDNPRHELRLARDGGPAQRWKLIPPAEGADPAHMDAEELGHGELQEEGDFRGTAQVHKSNPDHVHVTLMDGTRNATLTLNRHEGTKWKARWRGKPATEAHHAAAFVSALGEAGSTVDTAKTAHVERLTKLAARPGLWANIRKKRERGGKPAKPGQKGYPDRKNWKKLTHAKKGEHVSSHDMTMPDGTRIDVLRLHKLLEGMQVRQVPIDDLPAVSRSSRDGFSQNRYRQADTSFPLVTGEDNTVIDGRHRLLKQRDEGKTSVPVVTATPEHLEQAKIAAPFEDPRVGQRIEGKSPLIDLVFFKNRSTPQVLRPDLGDEPKPKAGYGDVTLQRRANPDEVKQLNAGKWLRVDEEGNTPSDPNYRITQYRQGLARIRQRALDDREESKNVEPHGYGANLKPLSPEVQSMADQWLTKSAMYAKAYNQGKYASAYIADVPLSSLPADTLKDVARFVSEPKGKVGVQYGMVVKELVPMADHHNLATARSHVRDESEAKLKKEFYAKKDDKFILVVNHKIVDGHHFLAKAERVGCTSSLNVLDLTGCRHQQNKKATPMDTATYPLTGEGLGSYAAAAGVGAAGMGLYHAFDRLKRKFTGERIRRDEPGVLHDMALGAGGGLLTRGAFGMLGGTPNPINPHPVPYVTGTTPTEPIPTP